LRENMPIPYISEPIIEIDNKLASQSLIDDILEIEVEENLHSPSRFTLIIQNDYFPGRTDDQAWRHLNLFEIGRSIKIGFISSTTQAEEFEQGQRDYVIEGEITAIETEFNSESQAPIIVRGYDLSHRLYRGRHSRSFQNVTDTDIVQQIAADTGIATGTIEETGGPYGYGDIGNANGYVFQKNQTNLEFLRELATRNGFELFLQNGKLNFRKPQNNGTLTLKWLEDIHSFKVRVTSAEQVAKVEVRGWDYQTKRPILETANQAKVVSENDFGQGSKTSTAFQGKPDTPTEILVDKPAFPGKQAKIMAQALCNELGGEFITAEAVADGTPLIRAGKVIQLQEMGKFSGKYYVTQTRHLFTGRNYTTELRVRGLRGDDALTTLTPENRLQPGQTPLVGIVTDNNDPKGWGRVRVKFPTLTEEHASYWARVVTLGAGANRGFDCLPEINDEVLVAFENGDIHRPYIVGGVWNGTDAPPEPVQDSVTQGKVRLRTFKTRIGHRLQFVDEDKGAIKKGVYLQTQGNHFLRYNDTDQFIELETAGHHVVRVDDKNRKILIKTSGGHTYELNDQSRSMNLTSIGDINVKAPITNKINLNAGQINLTGTQKITLTVGVSSIEISPAGVNICTTGSINIQGTSTNVDGTASANLRGATANVQGATVAINGGLVRINS
jgi:uncharacterized protein involved in type VI secretion and phage assembly